MKYHEAVHFVLFGLHFVLMLFNLETLEELNEKLSDMQHDMVTVGGI